MLEHIKSIVYPPLYMIRVIFAGLNLDLFVDQFIFYVIDQSPGLIEFIMLEIFRLSKISHETLLHSAVIPSDPMLLSEDYVSNSC